MKRLCYLGDAASVHVQRWAREFASRGNEVHILSFSNAQIENVIVHQLPLTFPRRSSGFNWQIVLALPRVRNIVRSISPDIVHAHYLTSYGLLGACSGAFRLVCSAWGSDVLVTPNKSFVYRLALRFVLRRSNKITSDSGFMGNKLLKLGLSQSKLALIPFGVDLSRFVLSRYVDTAFEGERLRLVSVRALEQNSNIDRIIQAFAVVHKKYPNLELEIYHQGPELTRLKALVSKLELGSHVKFYGSLPHSEMAEVWNRHSLAISIPTSDATSVSLLEAMACGAFPIVSAIPANREWIRDGVNGLVVSSENPDDLARGLERAIEDTALRKAAAIENRRIVEAEACWEVCVERMEQVYSALHP